MKKAPWLWDQSQLGQLFENRLSLDKQKRMAEKKNSNKKINLCSGYGQHKAFLNNKTFFFFFLNTIISACFQNCWQCTGKPEHQSPDYLKKNVFYQNKTKKKRIILLLLCHTYVNNWKYENGFELLTMTSDVPSFCFIIRKTHLMNLAKQHFCVTETIAAVLTLHDAHSPCKFTFLFICPIALLTLNDFWIKKWKSMKIPFPQSSANNTPHSHTLYPLSKTLQSPAYCRVLWMFSWHV